jgi:hypothetical protein
MPSLGPGVKTFVVADTETREFQDQATEMRGEGPEDASEVPPAGDTGTGAVQEQQGRALACLVIAQDTRVRGHLSKRAVVAQFHCHSLASLHTDSAGDSEQ